MNNEMHNCWANLTIVVTQQGRDDVQSAFYSLADSVQNDQKDKKMALGFSLFIKQKQIALRTFDFISVLIIHVNQ